MQDLNSSEKDKKVISDDNNIQLEYIPFKKRKLCINKNNILQDEAQSGNSQGWSKILAFSPVSQSKEIEKFTSEKPEKEEGVQIRGRGGRGTHNSRRALTNTNSNNHLNNEECMKNEQEVIISEATNSTDFSPTPFNEPTHGIINSSFIKTIYKIPLKYDKIDEEVVNSVRKLLHIEVSGVQVPPPILKFDDMKLPKPILKALLDKKILKPTEIQMQALPSALLGRDVIGVSSTGSGKTLVFVIPLIMHSWEHELRLPIKPLEGPFGLILSPSRELSSQICDVIEHFTSYIRRYSGPRLHSLCIIGGTHIQEQINTLKSGVHIVVATPGRLNHFLKNRIVNFSQCTYLCFDESDRIIDLGFEDEIKNILNCFDHQRQTLLFSSTMPMKIREFAKSALTLPISVIVGSSGSSNKNIKQHVVSVSKETKLPMVLHCLKKTPPPVLIFCENKGDVEIVNEYLILKGVESSCIHGGLSQEERNQSITDFKNLKKDVLIGTDIASKGLDFPSIHHVINFDLPRDFENYVHRIGRTGRGDEKGLATTLLDGSEDESELRKLKSILIESDQEIPLFLQNIHVNEENPVVCKFNNIILSLG